MYETEIAWFAERHGLDEAGRLALAKLLARVGARKEADSTIETLADQTLVAARLSDVEDTVEAGAAPPVPELPREPSERYEDLGTIGSGGMGEVRRVRDRVLGRTMAMKILRSKLLQRPRTVARFVEEAQATAQLQHPGIVPVHDFGKLPDGRLFFTMKEVKGHTLADAIFDLHLDKRPDGALRKIVDAFRDAAEAVAYAHARGVLHRDLKPSNIMLGAFGEVLVLDWGLVRLQDMAGKEQPLEDAVSTGRASDPSLHTVVGTVAGTPHYMPPEQAYGDLDAMSPRTDVYALGAILYEILAGQPPYAHLAPRQVIGAVRVEPPKPVSELCLGPVELIEICEEALARDPADRFADAFELARAVSAWLTGEQRRTRARALAADALALVPRARNARARAVELRSEATARLDEVPSHRPAADKASAWALEDEARASERMAERLEAELKVGLRSALQESADLPEAHGALVEHYTQAHRKAEAAHDPDAVVRAEVPLRAHALALPEGHIDRVEALTYLTGTGALTLRTDPPGARVELHRFVRRERRLIPVFDCELGVTPLAQVPVEMGSYVLHLSAPGREVVRYPVHISRNHRWEGVRPGSTESAVVTLPAAGTLGDNDCFVPAGWFNSGGDSLSVDSLPGRAVWVDGFVMQKHPVRMRDFLAFLDHLSATGREPEALRHVPREPGASPTEVGRPAMVVVEGKWRLQPDQEGVLWPLDWPVLLVSWESAWAYAGWLAQTTGLPWRLPTEYEWEKAARGVDARAYPWGDFCDPSWTAMNSSFEGAPQPVVVDEFPEDESVYGVRGLGGNASDLVAEGFSRGGMEPVDGVAPAGPTGWDPSASHVVLRGGNWCGSPRGARVCYRGRHLRNGVRDPVTTVRLVRSLS